MTREQQIADDRLVAEADGLRAEVERLSTANEYAFGELANLRAEIERLKELFALKWDATQSAETASRQAEVERLLDALKAIECHSIDHTDACRMAGKARAALEPKP